MCSATRSRFYKQNFFKFDMCTHRSSIMCLVLACIITLSAKADSIGTRSMTNKTTILPRQGKTRSISVDSMKNKTVANVSHAYQHKPIITVGTSPLSRNQLNDDYLGDLNMETKTKRIVSKLFTKYLDETFLSVENLHKLFKQVKESVSISHDSHHHTENNLQPSSVTSDHDGHTHHEQGIIQTFKAHSATNLKMSDSQGVNTTVMGIDHCLSLEEILQIFKFNHLKSLGPREFLLLSPILIDQLDSGYCNTAPNLNIAFHRAPAKDHDHHGHNSEADHDVHVNNSTDTLQAPIKAWCFTFLSIIIISVCCVVGAIAIPNMEKVFYNHILQFLVALAVGAMSSDAMLHLLPHALLSESHHANHHHKHDGDNEHLHNDNKSEKWTDDGQTPNHMTALYKGLVALMGMYGFFFLERCFTHFTKHRGMKKKRKSPGRSSCNDESRSTMLTSTLEAESFNLASCDAVVMVVHPNKALKAYADVRHDALLHSCDESLILSPSGCDVTGVRSGGNGAKTTVNGSVSEAVVSHGVSTPLVKNTLSGSNSKTGTNGLTSPCEPLSGQSGHGDAICTSADITRSNTKTNEHCHSHRNAGNLREALSSVAMMVIVGDLIHSFCAGLAIGTAYSGNTFGGLSTSVAVFCYELPHKIGDLAVLLRSGLTMKRAVCFNLLPSLPIFFGAIIGLCIGHIGSTSVWIFAGVGGMFLYITLVDLVPEMTSVYTKPGEPWFLHLLLQAIGISVGSTIMLIISVSEESRLTQYYNSGNE